MSRVSAVALGIWDFVVGDDWRIAVGVAGALAITAIVAGAGGTAWWILPVAVAALLGASVWRAARHGRG